MMCMKIKQSLTYIQQLMEQRKARHAQNKLGVRRFSREVKVQAHLRHHPKRRDERGRSGVVQAMTRISQPQALVQGGRTLYSCCAKSILDSCLFICGLRHHVGVRSVTVKDIERQRTK
jgi:hypothetical protein